MTRMVAIGVCMIALCGAATDVVASEEALADVLAQYDRAKSRGDFRERTLARTELARTHSKQALLRLLVDYDDPEDPKPQVRHLVASLVARYFQGHEHENVVRAYVSRHATSEHAWLWYLWSREYFKSHDAASELPVRVPSMGECAQLNAAVMFARAVVRPHEVAASIPRLVSNLPEDPLEQYLSVGAASLALVYLRAEVASAVRNRGIEALATLLEDGRLSDRSRLQLERQLAVAGYRDPNTGANPTAAVGSSDDTVSFAGLTTRGQRVCFLLDASESMNMALNRSERLAALEIPDAPSTPRTDGKPPRGQGGGLWEGPDTRWDLARRVLNQCLNGLASNQEFVVIVFAGSSKPMTKLRFVRATREHVQACKRALNAWRLGTSGGIGIGTNLYAGVRNAFSVGATKPSSARSGGSGPSGVSWGRIQGGFDTLFILSDGVPSQDDWTLDGWTKQVDGYGSYACPDQLIEEVARLNLFRRAEINCFTIGDAGKSVPCRLASVGLGKARFLSNERPLVYDAAWDEIAGFGCPAVAPGDRWYGVNLDEFTVGYWLVLLKSERIEEVGQAIEQLGVRANDAAQVIPALFDVVRRWVPASVAVAHAVCSVARRDSAQAVVAGLSDEDPVVRGVAADALGKMGASAPKKAQGALIELAQSDADDGVRSMAVGALGRLGRGSDEVITALRSALSDPRGFVRATAAWALGNLGPCAHAARADLKAVLGDPDSSVGREAANALTLIGRG